MAKRRMKKKGVALWIAMILGLLVALAIGGSFVAGKFLDVVILNWLPLMVHKIVGWIIIVGAIVSFVLHLMK